MGLGFGLELKRIGLAVPACHLVRGRVEVRIGVRIGVRVKVGWELRAG